MRSHKVYTALALLVCLSACAQLGLAPAQTFDEKLAYAYGTHTAVLKAATLALNAKTISSKDAEQVAKLADESRQLLDAAHVAENSGDITTANGRLLLATNVLEQLQVFLRARK